MIGPDEELDQALQGEELDRILDDEPHVASTLDPEPEAESFEHPVVPPCGKFFSVLGGFPDIKRGLLKRGWQDAGAAAQHVDLKWTCKRSDIEFATLNSPQLANHFEKIAELCTKVGLTRHLQESKGSIERDIDFFYPRTYHLVGPGEVEAFVSEYKLRKVDGILKEWLKHHQDGKLACQTFSEDVVRIALDVARRHLVDIDSLLDSDDNEPEGIGSAVFENEWAVLREVDMNAPSKEIPELLQQKQARLDHERTKDQLRLALAARVTDLQRLANRHQEKAAKKQQEKLRKAALREKLSRVVLKSKAGGSQAPAEVSSNDQNLDTVQEEVEVKAFSDETTKQNDAMPSPRTPHSSVDSSPKARKSSPAVEEEEVVTGEALRVQVSEILDAWKRSNPQFHIGGSRNIWILKPAGRARGEGIFLSSDLDKILQNAGQRCEMTTWICQKYIENPLLLKNRKHDLRQWVLVTCWNPLTVYFWGECYIRLAADEFGSGHDDISNNMRHLTNNAVIAHHPQFDKEDDFWMCMWSQETYQKFLSQTYGYDAWEKKVRPAMKQAVLDTLTAVQEPLANSKNGECCFEILGYDFMVDTNLGVWLLEVNTSPCMEYSTSITARLVPEVMEDSLKVLLGDGPPEAPYGRYELICKGPELGQEPVGLASSVAKLVLQGTRLRPPQRVVTEPVQVSDKKMADRRVQELEALATKQKQLKEKEQQKKERVERLRQSLKLKVWRSSDRLSKRQTLTRLSKTVEFSVPAAEEGKEEQVKEVQQDNDEA
eukprot:TRINITY_DN64294_c0_g1_i1.p1 TRINITY_DN64294_c0_g1~~TRINITY_DN64294_c0_g1_i1.p1  ORF type:complete len:772 (-),score=175.13 TRINITY_DN64294_c0_g1_i1:72-2387(-)